MDWLPNLRASPGPKYLAIATALIDGIRTGRLRPGDRLPPHRMLAERLGIDLTTVTRAYNEARRQGLIETGGRRGSFVRDIGAGIPNGLVQTLQIDTSMNMPPQPQGDILTDRLRTGWDELLRSPEAGLRLHYQASAGTGPDRAAAARLLSGRIPGISDESVVVTSGGQNALHGIIASSLRPGDVVCAANVTYPGFLSAAHRAGLRVVPIATDRHGLDPQALDEACGRERVSALYVIPTNDNPTTSTLDVDRRKAIADIAARHGVLVIEDDAYGQLPSISLPPISAFAPERAWYIASVSKIISPALRVAFVAAPSVRDAYRLADGIHATTGMAPPLTVALVTRWIEDGSYERVIAAVREEASARQRLAKRFLDPDGYAAHPEGYHLWVRLPDDVRRADVVAAAARAGLSLVASDVFAVDGRTCPNAVRVSLGGPRSREMVAQGLGVLDALMRQAAAPTAAVI
ncbi:MAG TPA: PLP-dependent aminotransferase family protein [Alphaproteobacteria bacterium]|nr:PLP-dependent aminotransferase family protein [Alphaproteobacteria bacterium]